MTQIMDNTALEAVARSVRTLTMDAVQAANSGHPGMPLGMAELGALLYGEILNHNPRNPQWENRDRFVLSAGHGSMFLYSLLHMAGYDLSLEDLKAFRQLDSKTPGHPEYGHTPGVETTTGPLGQGFANAVGMAVAEQMLAARFNTPHHRVVDHYTYGIVGDGCLMEGISSEASSLAGHLGLGKLIVFYDSNKISIEGSTDLAFTEDVAARYAAYGWQVLSCSAYDIEGIRRAAGEARNDTRRPTLVVLESVIGQGSPGKAGSAAAHGAPFGDEEIAATKEAIGVDPQAMFYVDPRAQEFFARRRDELAQTQEKWEQTFQDWATANPGLHAQWKEMLQGGYRELLKDIALPQYKPGDTLATRQASGAALKAVAAVLPNLVGGSADLAPSNNTALPEHGDFTRDTPAGRTVHFGVRELAMAAIANGMALHGGLRPFVATFMVFSDYLRPAARLSALMKAPVTYVLTHDSIFVGEDGPTHQPIEHVEALRTIPGMVVLRPADAEETGEAWLMAMEQDGPVALALTRQGLPVFPKADPSWRESLRRGAYLVQEPAQGGLPEVVVVATGSEVSLALKAAELSGRAVRVVSMISRELFEAQDEAFRRSLLPQGVPVVAAEAGVTSGWASITGSRDRVLGLDRFGLSGPAAQVASAMGFTAQALADLIKGV
ncbi:transketolase [Alkalispirochaeta americana]|uniref:Transketolase n=1 Tax=Alkalispirochaeta americana TaxID=159291 RepID=A0A1N6S4J5_9SPIO|nr:transketolase [Alkalispirochaeta americana]SIQ35886.1 transketolase [Alkalispirochaeta americana]